MSLATMSFSSLLLSMCDDEFEALCTYLESESIVSLCCCCKILRNKCVNALHDVKINAFIHDFALSECITPPSRTVPNVDCESRFKVKRDDSDVVSVTMTNSYCEIQSRCEVNSVTSFTKTHRSWAFEGTGWRSQNDDGNYVTLAEAQHAAGEDAVLPKRSFVVTTTHVTGIPKCSVDKAPDQTGIRMGDGGKVYASLDDATTKSLSRIRKYIHSTKKFQNVNMVRTVYSRTHQNHTQLAHSETHQFEHTMCQHFWGRCDTRRPKGG